MALDALLTGSTQAAVAAATAVPQATPAALEYHALSNGFWAADQAVALALPALLLLTGLAARGYARISKACGHRALPAIAVFAAGYFALDRGLRAVVGYFWDVAYGRATQTPAPAPAEWAVAKIGDTVPLLCAATLAAVVVYALLARTPRRAWLWCATAASLIFVGALLLEPYTQDYAPLGSSAPELRIARAAESIGIPTDRVGLQSCEPVDACPPGRVIGVGPTRLMLLNDALLRTNPEDWTLQTFAHEAKHFVEDDNVKAIVLLVSLSFAFAWLIDRIGGAVSRRWGRRLGFSAIAEPASLPLVVLLFGLIQLAILPPLNAYRQHVELEADRFALEMTRRNSVQAAMLADAARGALAVPESSLFAKLFRNSHPSDADRIRFSETYRPWAEHRPLRYGRYFRHLDSGGPPGK